MSPRLAVIAGAGGVLGAALVGEFEAAGYDVATLRRDAIAQGASAVGEIVATHGAVDVLVYNAAHLVVAPFAELTGADFEAAWRASVLGAVACSQAVLPGMLRRRRGALLFSGATASVRGAARFAAFASAKFALRGLAQSLAREHHAQGVHVAHVVLDGLLRGSPSVGRSGGRADQALDPGEVARAYRWLAEQPASAWAHEIDLRPHSEKF
jgi:NADP-dependent 3-hydroxy acid dehydrogenase YdfG